MQETFLALWNRAETFDPTAGSLAAWLHAIARNRAIDRLRAAGRRPSLVACRRRRDPMRTRPRRSNGSSGGTVVGGRDPRRARSRPSSRRAAGGDPPGAPTMPDDERTVILLAYQEDLSQTEIAERLGWPLGTVKTRTRRALLRLREVWSRVRARRRARRRCRCQPARIDKDTMDHEETREQLELAALEPGGLERLMAGDTPRPRRSPPTSPAVPSCTEELVRLGRSSALIRDGRARDAAARPAGADPGRDPGRGRPAAAPGRRRRRAPVAGAARADARRPASRPPCRSRRLRRGTGLARARSSAGSAPSRPPSSCRS